MFEEAIENRLRAMERAGFEPNSRPTGIQQPSLTRRGFLRTTGGLILATGFNSLEQTVAQAAAWQTQEVEYEQGKGRRSLYWGEAIRDVMPTFAKVQQADQEANGENALSVRLGYSIADRIWEDQQRQLTYTPRPAAGLCFQTAVAMGDCPIIDGPIEAFGVVFSKEDQEIIAPYLYTGSKELKGWGKLPEVGPYVQKEINGESVPEERGEITPGEYQYIKDIMFWNRVNKQRLVFVVNTAKAKNKPENEEWWACVTGTEGEDLVCTDISGENRGGSPPIIYMLHHSQATRVALVDPIQPHPGAEKSFNETLPRDIAKVSLRMAVATAA